MQAGIIPGGQPGNQASAALSDPADLKALDAEASVLGYLMQCGPREAIRVAEDLASFDFVDSRNQVVFQAVEALLSPETIPTDTAVRVQLQQTGRFQEVGGAAYLEQLLGVGALDLEDALTSVNQLRAATARRQLNLAGDQIKALALRTGLELAECQQQAQQLLSQAVQRDTLDLALDAQELQARSYDRMEQWRAGNFPETIPFGLPDLDWSLSVQAGDFGVICGDTGAGKSSFAFQICTYAAEQGHPLFIGEYEMSYDQTSDRLISQKARISANLMKGRKYQNGVRLMPTEAHFNQWQAGVEWLGSLPLKAVCKGGMSVDTIASMMRLFQLEQQLLGNQKTPILLIDYLQLQEGVESNNRARDVARMSRAFKKLAMRLDIAVIALSQLSRNNDAKDKRPTRGRLKESSAIEQDANWILGLYVPEPEEGGDEAPPIVDNYEVIKLKDREGSRSTIRLIWYTESTHFVSVHGTNQQAQAQAQAAAPIVEAPPPEVIGQGEPEIYQGGEVFGEVLLGDEVGTTSDTTSDEDFYPDADEFELVD